MLGLLQMMLSSGYVGANGDESGGELDADTRQMLAAHLQQADPIMYDIIEKVCGTPSSCAR